MVSATPRRWRLAKRRRLLGPQQGNPLWLSHAQAPTVLQLPSHRWIVYFAGRDARNRSRVFAADLDPADMSIRRVHDDPVLDLGAPGTFDEHGVGPGTAIVTGDRILLFYSGVRTCPDVPYEAGIGLAESTDGGLTFRRFVSEPLVGVSARNPFGASTPTVHRVVGGWVMWYSSFQEWRDVDGKPELIYDIRCARSADGLAWTPDEGPALPFADADEGGLVRTQIMDAGPDGWLLIVAARGWRDFRAGQPQGYRLICARSADRRSWTRDPDALVIDDAGAGDWDAGMRCYPWLVEDGDRRFLFFNGNDFGRHGFGVGELVPVDEEDSG